MDLIHWPFNLTPLLLAWLAIWGVVGWLTRHRLDHTGTQHWDDAATERLMRDLLRDDIRVSALAHERRCALEAALLLSECGYRGEVRE